jgi:hypothetical protein
MQVLYISSHLNHLRTSKTCTALIPRYHVQATEQSVLVCASPIVWGSQATLARLVLTLTTSHSDGIPT